MARQNNSAQAALASSNTKQPTAAEMRKWYEENKSKLENFADGSNALRQLQDIQRSTSKTVTAFNRETLRGYLQNIGSNEKNLRSLSRYLFYRSQVYFRLIMYNANMFYLHARAIIPNYNLMGDNDDDAILQSYYDTAVVLDRMRLQDELLKAYIICFREDVFYGCVYYDDTGMFILPLDPDYCKIVGAYQDTGDFSFAMDMSYFRSKQTILEYWGEPFQSMYRAYENDTTNGRWQLMPDEYAICMKYRVDDYETIVPIFSGMFNALINLIDLEDIQAVADKQDIYKMVWLGLETIQGSNQVDDWKVDPALVVEYFNRMLDSLPDYIGAALVPGKLESITFDDEKVKDTNKIAKSTETVLNTSGGAQILNSATISGTTAFEAAIQADTEFAISTLLPQTQSWVNRFLKYHVTNPAYVKFLEVSVYTREAYKKSLRDDVQYGLTSKLMFNSLNGFSELQTLSLMHVEENILKLTDRLRPPKSSNTLSSDDAGRPTEDDAGDTADESKEKRDKAGYSRG